MEEEPLVLHEALYKVTVYTGTVPGAGTDANVSVVAVTGGGGLSLYSHCIYWDCTLGSCGGGGVVDQVCTATVYTGIVPWAVAVVVAMVDKSVADTDGGGGGVVDKVCTVTMCADANIALVVMLTVVVVVGGYGQGLYVY